MLQFVLFAQFIEVVGSLIGLALLVLWVVRQIMDANKQQPPPQRGRQAAPQPPAAARGGAQMAGQQADPLRNQVEEFLRRAGRPVQPNQQAPPRAPQHVPDEFEALLGDEQRPATRTPVEPMPPAPPEPPPAAPRTAPLKRVRQPAPGRRKRATLAERAAQRDGARARMLAQQSAQLGKRIIEEDHQFDVQLKAKFDHTLGTLSSGISVTADEAQPSADSPAAQIAAMLAHPEGMRQAMVLNEILRRPTDNW